MSKLRAADSGKKNKTSTKKGAACESQYIITILLAKTNRCDGYKLLFLKLSYINAWICLTQYLTRTCLGYSSSTFVVSSHYYPLWIWYIPVEIFTSYSHNDILTLICSNHSNKRLDSSGSLSFLYAKWVHVQKNKLNSRKSKT